MRQLHDAGATSDPKNGIIFVFYFQDEPSKEQQLAMTNSLREGAVQISVLKKHL